MEEIDIRVFYPGPNLSKRDKKARTYPYLLRNLPITRQNQVWSIDISYLGTPSGFVYIVAIIDWYSRFIVGWSISNTLHLFDNRYGTGQSVWDGIMRTTNLVVAGKTVVVAGYGWCGKGVALRAKGLGARVIVCEINSIKANEAWMDGFEVMPMVEAAPHGDVFITVTGNKDVITGEHFKVMKPGAIMCNAGHFDVEVNKVQLGSMSKSVQVVRPNIEEFTLQDGKRLYLLAEGRLVNLAAGDGHPAEVMDMTFALQALSLKYVAENADRLERGVHTVPDEIDQRVAELRLESLGLKIDHLSEEQKAYLEAWHD